jgi:hypothetical protein
MHLPFSHFPLIPPIYNIPSGRNGTEDEPDSPSGERTGTVLLLDQRNPGAVRGRQNNDRRHRDQQSV